MFFVFFNEAIHDFWVTHVLVNWLLMTFEILMIFVFVAHVFFFLLYP